MKLTDEVGPYASWRDTGSSRTVEYSLPVLHEIEALVNESFRRVAHGGMEVGGLLLGEPGATRVRVDGFAPIQCSHAAGPAFVLTDAEVDQLNKQIAQQRERVVGWFISHARGLLAMSDWEAGFIRNLFPPGAITVIAKPERMKPTQFAFFTGIEDREGSERAFVLPPLTRMPRGANEAEPAAAATPATAPPGAGEVGKAPAPADPVLPKVPPPPPATPIRTQTPAPQQPVGAPSLTEALRMSDPRYERPETPAPGLRSTTFEPRQSFPPPSAAEAAPAVESHAHLVGNDVAKLSGLVWVLIGAAVAFAFLAAYGFYRSAVPQELSLRVAAQGGKLTVSWPAEQSRQATEAQLRVNDGPVQPLSEEAKQSGITEIESDDENIKVELILKRWGRESHTVDRYLKTAKIAVRSASHSPASGTAAPAP